MVSRVERSATSGVLIHSRALSGNGTSRSNTHRSSALAEWALLLLFLGRT